MATPSPLRPSKTAEGLLALMTENESVQREILTETLESQADGQILESGRTLCSSTQRIKGPVGRFPRAVDLQQCPVSGKGGAWHTHVTPSQLLNPQNSLPDMATVVYGDLDVIGVVGTETAEYFMAGTDRDEMQREFQDALGAEIQSQSDLLAAIQSGRVTPATARSRARKRLDGLITRQDTGYADLTEQARSGRVMASSIDKPYETVEVSMLVNTHTAENSYHEMMATPRGCNFVASEIGSDSAEKLSDAVPDAVKSTALGAAVGTVVGSVVERLLPI